MRVHALVALERSLMAVLSLLRGRLLCSFLPTICFCYVFEIYLDPCATVILRRNDILDAIRFALSFLGHGSSGSSYSTGLRFVGFLLSHQGELDCAHSCIRTGTTVVFPFFRPAHPLPHPSSLLAPPSHVLSSSSFFLLLPPSSSLLSRFSSVLP